MCLEGGVVGGASRKSKKGGPPEGAQLTPPRVRRWDRLTSGGSVWNFWIHLEFLDPSGISGFPFDPFGFLGIPLDPEDKMRWAVS